MPEAARLQLVVVAAGVVGGAVGAAYLLVLHLLQHGLWPDRSSLLVHGLVLVGVGSAVAGLVAWLGGSGGVELLVDNIHVSGRSEDVRGLRSLLPVSLLCVASGGALGPEAPLVQTTGTLGSWTAGRLRLAPDHSRIVTITGMAAGFTVLFGAPLGSAVFALEILHRRGLEYYEALLPSVVGALCGYAVFVVLAGAGIEPVWTFPALGTVHRLDLVWAVLCGCGGAVVAVAFTLLCQGLGTAARAVPAWGRAPLAGLVLALLAWVSPFALTFGEAQLGTVAAGGLAVGTLLLAAAAKLVASAVTVAGGWKGGFIIPLFFMGACLGSAAHLLAPSTNGTVLIAAAMVACCVGVTKTPLGSVLVVTEMAGVALLPTTLVASVVALLLTSRVGLIASQRRRADPLAEVSPTGGDDGPG